MGGHNGYGKKVAVEAKLRSLWEQVGEDTFVEALALFADAKSIAAKYQGHQALQDAWQSVGKALALVQQSQDEVSVSAMWEEIEHSFDANTWFDSISKH